MGRVVRFDGVVGDARETGIFIRIDPLWRDQNQLEFLLRGTQFDAEAFEDQLLERTKGEKPESTVSAPSF